MRVDGTGYAVRDFDVEFRNDIFYKPKCTQSGPQKKTIKNWHRTRVDGSLADIPHCSALNHVPHRESFNSLILRDCARAVRAAEEDNVSTAFLVSAAISSFLGLQREACISIKPAV
jgi:hypothetical protein